MRTCLRSGLLALVLVLMNVGVLHAQTTSTATLTGTVTDSTSRAPLPGVHVFIAGSTIGTTTGDEGRYQLTGVPPGNQRLYVSMLGYASATVDTLLRADRSYTIDVALQPTVLESEGVTVEAERDDEWAERLQKFKRLFLGRSTFADHCILTNPEVLRFEDGWFKPFRAEASEPLVVNNYALGYRITYFLEEFTHSGATTRWDGEPLFDPLVPKDSAEAAKWRDNRQRAYTGSMRHFLRALLNNRVREEGFMLSRPPPMSDFRPSSSRSRFTVSADRVLEREEDTSAVYLDFSGRLEIVYRDEQEEREFLHWQGRHRSIPGPQTSFIKLNDPSVTLDATGEIVEPYGATVFGYFAFERLADQVPQDYQPDRTQRPH